LIGFNGERPVIRLAMLTILTGLGTAGAKEPAEVMTAGFGAQSSCASWSSDDSQGSIWLLGYWSGRNVEGQKAVGSTTDADGILEEVRAICKAEPSRPMIDAVAKVYKRFLDEGR
jgi:hypothetical protein